MTIPSTLDALEHLRRHAANLSPVPLRGRFHAHLTVSIAGEELSRLEGVCREQKTKLTVIDLDSWDGRSQRDVMTTSYYLEEGDDSLIRIIENLKTLGEALERAGFPVVRAKLEHESQPSLSQFSESQYHEVHIKLAIPGAELAKSTEALRVLGAKSGFVASRNPREVRGEVAMQFVNLRIYSGTEDEASRRIEEIQAELVSHEFQVEEIKRETVVFDTRQSLDAWWA
ncbi:MAG: hypothetical protein AAF517_13720 [Planctomycetota bacterium]